MPHWSAMYRRKASIIARERPPALILCRGVPHVAPFDHRVDDLAVASAWSPHCPNKANPVSSAAFLPSFAWLMLRPAKARRIAVYTCSSKVGMIAKRGPAPAATRWRVSPHRPHSRCRRIPQRTLDRDAECALQPETPSQSQRLGGIERCATPKGCAFRCTAPWR